MKEIFPFHMLFEIDGTERAAANACQVINRDSPRQRQVFKHLESNN